MGVFTQCLCEMVQKQSVKVWRGVETVCWQGDWPLLLHGVDSKGSSRLETRVTNYFMNKSMLYLLPFLNRIERSLITYKSSFM